MILTERMESFQFVNHSPVSRLYSYGLMHCMRDGLRRSRYALWQRGRRTSTARSSASTGMELVYACAPGTPSF